MSTQEEDTQGMGYLDTSAKRWVTVYAPLGIFVFVLLFPFYWMVITSFKPNKELLSRDGNPFWVIEPTLDHFKKLLFVTAYPEWLWNTVIVSTVASRQTSGSNHIWNTSSGKSPLRSHFTVSQRLVWWVG